jgi:hypothetical protein
MAHDARHHRAFQRPGSPALPDASGYHDPVTARFVSATRLARKKRGFEEACFERNRVDELAPRPVQRRAARSIETATLPLF